MTVPIDVTVQFNPGDLPRPPVRDFLSPAEVMKNAEIMGYLGKLTEAEAKQVITRSFQLTKLTDLQIGVLIDVQELGYDGVRSEFIRHAIEMLIAYYESHGILSSDNQGIISDVLRRQHELRLDAERARIRAEFSDSITALDDELNSSRRIDDYEHIAHRLTKYREMLRTCESETQRRLLREVLAGSTATRAAVIAFYLWAHDSYRPPVDNWQDAWVELSETWARFYEDMQ